MFFKNFRELFFFKITIYLKDYYVNKNVVLFFIKTVFSKLFFLVIIIKVWKLKDHFENKNNFFYCKNTILISIFRRKYHVSILNEK